MRTPDPKANTTTEAYLAYKAGYLEESELKPVLYKPYLHFDGWLAYWAGLTTDYPHGTGKNLAPSLSGYAFGRNGSTTTYSVSGNSLTVTTVRRGAGVFMSRNSATNIDRCPYLFQKGYVVSMTMSATTNGVLRFGADVAGGRIDIDVGPEPVRVSFVTYDNSNIFFYQQSEGTLEYTISDIQCEYGSTATTYEPYTIIPEMLCDEEALVAYLSGVTDTYPEEIKDPYDVRIVGYLKHLVSVRWPEPDYPVNNSEFYLSTMKPAFVSSGDPSADIELDDTAEAPFIDLKMYGDTYQQTYSGNNLLDLTNGTYDATGVTAVVDNGIITLNGTATANSFISIPVSTNYSINTGEQFTLCLNNETVNANCSLRVNSGGQYDVNGSQINNSRTSTLDASLPLLSTSITIRTQSGGTYTNYVVKPQLVNGATALPYEPYVGGVPAPNPDYPQDVNVVTGEQTVSVSGKNLCWEVGKVNNNSMKFSVKNVDNLSTTNVLSFNCSTIVESESSIFLYRDDGVGENLGFVGSLTTTASGTNTVVITLSQAQLNKIATSSGVNFRVYRAGIWANATADDVKNAQIEVGSTATTYEPYQSQSYEINLGKNLFDKTTPIAASDYSTVSQITDGIRVTSIGTGPSRFVRYLLFSTENFIGQTITLSANMQASASNNPRLSLGLCSADGTNRSVKINLDSSGSESYVVEKDSSRPFFFINFYCNNSGTLQVGDYVDYTNIQLEVGSATPYAPYFTPIELCKIGDYQDYIYKNGDDWYVHKEIGKQTINGDSSWTVQYAKTNFIYYQTTSPIFIPTTISEVPAAISTQLIAMSGGDASNSDISAGFAFSVNGYLRANLPKSSFADTTAVKNHFTSYPMDVYYALSTPTDTQITNSELISQLDALKEGGSYKGKTYIKVTATDPNLPGLLYVEAGKYD